MSPISQRSTAQKRQSPRKSNTLLHILPRSTADRPQFDKEFSASFGIAHLIKGAFGSLTSKEDLAKIKKFFDGRGEFLNLDSDTSAVLTVDISRYKLSVHQVYDTIQAASDWLERDQQDVEQVSPPMG